jgi:predicted aldo/keto reductase-like oxidoreductase
MLRYSQFVNPHTAPHQSRARAIFEYLVIILGIAPMALMAIPEDKRPVSCLHCRSCEQVCPQQIQISAFMSDFVSKVG